MKRRAFLVLAAALLPCSARAQAAIEAMRFSALQPGAPLPDWLKKQSFQSIPRHTEFALVADEGRTVLRARSQAATAGLALDAVDQVRDALRQRRHAPAGRGTGCARPSYVGTE